MKRNKLYDWEQAFEHFCERENLDPYDEESYVKFERWERDQEEAAIEAYWENLYPGRI